MKFYAFLFLLFLGNTSLIAQQDYAKWDVQLGAGFSLLGTGDVWTLAFENELNYKLNPYFTLGTSVGFAKGTFWDTEGTAYVQGNLNVFYSPFRNNHRHNFRVGTGVSLIDVDHTWLSFYASDGGTRTIEQYSFEEYTVFGINILLDYSVAINDKLLLGAKAFAQPYQDGHINSGIMLRIGTRL